VYALHEISLATIDTVSHLWDSMFQAASIRREYDGLPNGRTTGKQVDSPSDIKELWGRWSSGGEPAPRPDYNGARVRQDDGTEIGLRNSARNGPTIDVRFPDGTTGKVHVK
jgi:hypothetical protein